MGSVRDHVKISVGEIIVQAVNLVAGLLLVVRVHLLVVSSMQRKAFCSKMEADL